MQEQRALVAPAQAVAPMVIKTERESSLRDILDVLFRHQRTVVLFFLVTVVAVTVFTFMTDEVYESGASVMLKMGREYTASETAALGGAGMAATEIENYVNTEIDIIRSGELAHRVVNDPRLNPYGGMDVFLLPLDDLKPIKEGETASGKKKVSFLTSILLKLGLLPEIDIDNIAAGAFQKNFLVEVTAQTNTIVIRYRGQSAEISQKVLEVAMDLYRKRHTEVHTSSATPDFFKGLQDESLTSHSLAVKNLTSFTQANGLKDFDAQLANASAQYYGSLTDTETARARVETTEGLIKAAQARITEREKSLLAYMPVTELSRVEGRPNVAIDNLKDRIAQMKIDRITLSKNFLETSPQMVNVNKRIEEAEALLGGEDKDVAEVTTGINDAYEAVRQALDADKAVLQGLMKLQEDLNSKLESYNKQITSLSALKPSLTDLREQVDMANASYKHFRQAHQIALTNEGMDKENISNIRVINGATRPTAPIKPRKLLNILTGIFLGIVGGCALAFLLDYLDDSFKTNEDVERRLGLPVLTAVPYSLSCAVAHSVAFKERPPINQMPSQMSGGNKEPA